MTGTAPIPVLMVDDRPENLTALSALLSELELSLDLVAARSADEGLRHCLKRDFALVLLDVQMPGMDGMDMAALLRASPRTRHLPIIFVTAGLGMASHLAQGYGLGAVDFLVKPIEPLVLRSKVTVFCTLYQQRKELEAVRADLEARSAQLHRAMDQIVESEKLASLGAIVAGVAHELNTPIGNIVTMASSLEARIADFSKLAAAGCMTRSQLNGYVEQCQGASAILLRSALRASELIESFKKVAVDQASARRRQFDLRDTVTDIAHTLGTAMRHANVKMAINIPAGITMDGFPGDLEQILNNLIMNSLHHGFDKAGGTITVEGGQVDAEHVQLIYRDDGAGIAPELQRKVFEPFYTTKLGQGGSGLGMFIVRNLTHGSLKGDIRLDSAPGRGVCFTLLLPRVVPPRPSECAV